MTNGKSLQLLAAIGALALVTALSSFPVPELKRFGDDFEYLLMSESLVRHGTADFRDGDDAALFSSVSPRFRKAVRDRFLRPLPAGYFVDRSGEAHSWHFFLYPLVALPPRLLLSAMGLEWWQAFPLINLLAFVLALASCYWLHRTDTDWRLVLGLTFLTPILWFLPVVHPESFVFGLGVAAAMAFLSGRRWLAFILNSLGAMQFQPSALISVFYACSLLQGHVDLRTTAGVKRTVTRLALIGLVGLINAVPVLWTYCNFGVGNLVAESGMAGISFMSWSKLGSLFLDPNIGMVGYSPGILLLFFLALGTGVVRAARHRAFDRLALPLLLVIGLAACTTNRTWNHGTHGISRYALYFLPAFILYIALELGRTRNRGLQAIMVVCIGIQMAVIWNCGPFRYRGARFVEHNLGARVLLERAPWLYSPHPQVFCYRTTGKMCRVLAKTGLPADRYYPIVWRDSHGRPRKALLNGRDRPKLLGIGHRWSFEERRKIDEAYRHHRGETPFYLNF